MPSARVLTGVAAAAVLVAVSAVAVVRAGDVNPPSGPVQGTMRTLDEIYALFSQGIQSGNAGRWNYKYRASTGITVIATNAGVLHGIVVNPCQGCPLPNLYDAASDQNLAGKEIVAIQRASHPSEGGRFIPLDVVFENGLVLEMPSGPDSPVTVIYRADSLQPNPSPSSP